MTTTSVTTTSATTTRSLLPTRPETGRGQASLWTAAAAPDHRLWTTLRGPVDPSRLPTLPPPTTTGRASSHASITTNQRRDDLLPCFGRRHAGDHQKALIGGPFLN